jgi:probable rRNA maturation factor
LTFTIEINAANQPHKPDRAALKKAVRLILQDADIESAEISIAIVSDEKMHELNRQYLNHDFPTDVLSFLLDHNSTSKHLEGQIIANSDFAGRAARQYDWTTDDELLLYVIHGCLHLIGHDDATPNAKQAMRAAEAKYLQLFGLEHRFQ